MSTKVGTAILDIRTDVGQVLSNLKMLEKELGGINSKVRDTSTLYSGLGKVLAGAFTATAIISAGKQVLDYAGHVSDLAATLSISTTAVQQWEQAFGPAGVSIDTVAKASAELTNKLVGGDKSAVGALRKMGLSVAELKAMNPEERFIKVADAVGRLQNDGEKLYASKTLFGKGGVEMLAALDGQLESNIARMTELGLVIDEETIKAADDFGDQLGFLGKQLLGIVATVIGPLLPALSQLGNVLSWLGRNVIGPVLTVAVKGAMTALSSMWVTVATVLGGIAQLASKLPGVGDKFAGVAKWLNESRDGTLAYIEGLWDQKGATDQAGEAAAKATPKLIGLGKAADESSIKKFGEAMAELTSATGDYLAIVGTVNGAVVEAIKYYLEAGVSQSALATAYGLTATQVKAVATAMEAEKKAVKELITFKQNVAKEQAESLKPMSEAVLENVKIQVAAEKELWRTLAELSMSGIDFQLAEVDRWVLEERAKLDKRANNYAAADAAIVASAEARRDELRRLAEIEDVKLRFTFVGPEQEGANPIDTTGERIRAGLGPILESIPRTISQAFQNGGQFMGAIQSIATQLGAQLGKMVGSAFGKLGAIIGEQVGALAGLLVEKTYDALTVSAGEDVMHRVGRNWGVRITEAMGDQIAKDAKELFGGSRQAAELFNMKAIFEADQQNLGITKRNYEQAARALKDVFSMIETGQMTIAQGAKVIDENWSDLVEAGTDSFGFISDSLREIIALDQRFGTQSKEVAAFLKQQGEAAIAASNAVLASIAPMVAGWKAVKDRVDAANKAWDEAKKRGDTAAMLKADREWAEAQKELTALTAAHRDELEDLGTVALATFAAAIESGKTFAEALEAAGPGLATLIDGFKALQVETDNAALKALMLQSEMLQRNPALVNGVSSLGQAFAALSNMGMLNADTFRAMERTGAQMYARLQAEAAAVGGSTKDALLPMQDYLHRAQRAAEELGIPLDDNTKMLIDQSKELGIWKEAGKSATDKMIDGVDRLISKMDELINKIFGIPDPTITPRIDMPEMPELPSWMGQWPSDPSGPRIVEGIPMARGGYGRVTSTTPFILGEAGAEDFAVGGAGRSLAADVAEALSSLLPSGSSQELVLHNYIDMDGQRVAENTVKRVVQGKGGLDVALREKLVLA